jgi:anti-sigma B factor antagonist
VLHVEGDVDLATAPLLKKAIAHLYRTNRRVVVDLSRVDYLDGSGIRGLEYYARTETSRFVVVGSKPEIHRLFNILQLTDVLPVVVSLNAALDYLRHQ